MTEQRKTLTLKRKKLTDSKLDATALLAKKGRLIVPEPKEKTPKIASPDATHLPSESTSIKKSPITLEPKNAVAPKPAKPMPYKEAIALLTTYWPALFSDVEAEIKPLKVGIRDDLRKDRIARNLPFLDKKIRRALKTYARTAQYLQKLTVAGTPRYDISGVPVGMVSEEEAALAKERLIQL